MAEHDLPAHPLVSQGFPSVGCWPCTKPVDDPNADVRAGRWAGQDKTECGIHVAPGPGRGPERGRGDAEAIQTFARGFGEDPRQGSAEYEVERRQLGDGGVVELHHRAQVQGR